MTDLAASTTRQIEPPGVLNEQVADGVQTYAGALAGLRGPDHATSQGYLDGYDDEKGMLCLGGFLDDQVLGDTNATDPPRATVHYGTKLAVLTVTGVTGRGDVTKPVYAADNNTFTLTRPTLGDPIGIVWKHLAGTTCLVLLVGVAERVAAGTQTELLFLGELDFSTVIDGDVRTGFPMPFHGEILEVFGMVREVCVGTGGSIALNLEIGGTDVTGGVVTFSTAAADTLGKKLAGSAVTADNVFHEGDLLDVEGSGAAGTRTSGLLELYAKVQRRLGN